MKKTNITTFVSLLISIYAFAQAPQLLNYQGVARNNGSILSNTFVKLRFTIHDANPNGTIIFQETQAGTPTNAYGLFTAQIGSGTVNSGTFNTINWSNGAKYLQVEIDPSNGSTFTDLGTTQLVSVPYALQANKADTAKYSLFAAATPTTVSVSGNQITVNGVSATLPTPIAPTVQKFTSGSGTYTTPNGVKWIKVSMVGGGGGGAAGYNLTASAGDGGSTSFGTTLLTCTGGAHGTHVGDNEAAGGTATINSPAYGTAIDGAIGSSSAAYGTNAIVPGPPGASTPFGGGGGGTGTGSGYIAGSAKNNTGAGGGGGGQGGSDPSGGSGGAGGYLVAFIANPSATYSYVVGTGGIAGVGGISGGAGGSGIIIVEEYYQ